MMPDNRLCLTIPVSDPDPAVLPMSGILRLQLPFCCFEGFDSCFRCSFGIENTTRSEEAIQSEVACTVNVLKTASVSFFPYRT